MELVLVNVHMPNASSGESKEPGQHLSSGIQETLKGQLVEPNLPEPGRRRSDR